MGVVELKSRHILKKGYFPDFFFGSSYSFSPYMGCQHGCLNCDGRAEKYHFEGSFKKDIRVRVNTPERLEQEPPLLL